MIGSTNEEASSRARRGERGPLWITAEAQTAGRGRLGRSWNSPPGNLYASLLMSEPSAIERAPELAFPSHQVPAAGHEYPAAKRWSISLKSDWRT
jgi:biotin-(acetyl-CoA carboxylase) ligase